MKIDLIAIGRLKSGAERDLCERYAERFRGLGRTLALDGPRMIEIGESLARRDDDRKREEAKNLLSQMPDAHTLLVFDEHGSMMTSAGFASMIRIMRDKGTTGISFIIGGADGLHADVQARAQASLAFGGMTIPHQLVRVLVLEQLYRAATILAGHPYHRE